MLKIINTAKWKIADKFFKLYKEKLIKQHPELNDKTIEILENQSFDNDKRVDGSPLAMRLKDLEPCFDCYTLVYVKNYPSENSDIEQTFSEKELFAIIGHEIGHMSAHYTGNDVNGLTEEIIADQCAYDLGLVNDLIQALEKMKRILIKENEEKELNPIGFLYPKTNTIQNLQARILVLKHTIALSKIKKCSIRNTAMIIIAIIIFMIALICALTL